MTKPKTEAILFRFKEKDGIASISAETFDKLCKELGMNKTKTIHFALIKLAESYGIFPNKPEGR